MVGQISNGDGTNARTGGTFVPAVTQLKYALVETTTKRKPYITKAILTYLMMSIVANGDSLRLVGLLGTNNGCKILANEG